MQHGTQGDKIVIATVGLPARGKTYIAHKLKVPIVKCHESSVQVHLKLYHVDNFLTISSEYADIISIVFKDISSI